MSLDSQVIASIFASEGASSLTWEVASACKCFSRDTLQPNPNCPDCNGYGTVFAAEQTVKGLFRTQSRWISPRQEGELARGDAQLTTPLDVKPGYRDRRIRDRFTVVQATGDARIGKVFFPAAEPVPFLFHDEHLGWRVTLQSLEQSQRIEPQP